MAVGGLLVDLLQFPVDRWLQKLCYRWCISGLISSLRGEVSDPLGRRSGATLLPLVMVVLGHSWKPCVWAMFSTTCMENRGIQKINNNKKNTFSLESWLENEKLGRNRIAQGSEQIEWLRAVLLFALVCATSWQDGVSEAARCVFHPWTQLQFNSLWSQSDLSIAWRSMLAIE